MISISITLYPEIKYKEQNIERVEIFYVNVHFECAGDLMDYPDSGGQLPYIVCDNILFIYNHTEMKSH